MRGCVLDDLQQSANFMVGHVPAFAGGPWNEHPWGVGRQHGEVSAYSRFIQLAIGQEMGQRWAPQGWDILGKKGSHELVALGSRFHTEVSLCLVIVCILPQ